MDVKKANKVYDVLVRMEQSVESDREDFIYQHCEYSGGCLEWLLDGNLKPGGKYKSATNTVSVYSTPISPKRRLRDMLIDTINIQLSHCN